MGHNHHILVCANVVILNEVWMSTDLKGEAMLCTSHTCHHDFRKICISVDLVLLPMLKAAWLASSVADRTTARYTVRIGLGKK